MKKFKENTNNTSHLLFKQMRAKNNKPGQNQSVTIKTCILNLIKLLGDVNPLTFLKLFK